MKDKLWAVLLLLGLVCFWVPFVLDIQGSWAMWWRGMSVGFSLSSSCVPLFLSIIPTKTPKTE